MKAGGPCYVGGARKKVGKLRAASRAARAETGRTSLDLAPYGAGLADPSRPCAHL
jgi:hypothetical protein